MKQCLFCDETKLTDEHIYADWIVQHFKKHAPPRRGQYKQTHLVDGNVVHENHQGTVEEKRELVCGGCNNGWMSAIEHFAKPTLLPLIDNGLECQPRIFSPEEKRAIAIWVQLRSIIFDALTEPEDHYYTREERLAFANADSFTPLPNAFIWVAPFHGMTWCTTRKAGIGRPTERNRHIDSTAHVATGTVNKLAFQLFISRGSSPLALNFVNLQRGGWFNTTRRVFPSVMDVDWPPSLYVGEDSLDAFQDRLMPTVIKFRR